MGFIILVGKGESFSSVMLNESLSLYFDLQGRIPSELESTNENAKPDSLT